MITSEPSPFEAEMQSLRQWLKDREMSGELGDKQARFLVDDYYIIQENRKRLANQSRALTESSEPDAVVQWLCAQDERLEMYIKAALASYVKTHKMGDWLAGTYGIGPVLAAGLLAHIDINKAPTVGHIWQFFGIAGAGQNVWQAKTKRPWNAQGKTLTFKIGDSFIKFSNRDDCYYGKLYRQRKLREIAKNDAGDFAEQAIREAPKKDKTTKAWPWNAACYPAGTSAAIMALDDQDKRDKHLKSTRGEPGSGIAMLHPGHINDRARRYAVKQFLADLHGEWYRREFGREPPLPYPIAHLDHAHIRDAAD